MQAHPAGHIEAHSFCAVGHWAHVTRRAVSLSTSGKQSLMHTCRARLCEDEHVQAA